MKKAAEILQGASLAWSPTILQSLLEDPETGLPSTPHATQGDKLTAALNEFASILASDDADALEELISR